MKGAAILLFAAAAMGVAYAKCPNACSGHGTCGDWDKCTCWSNWQGADCSERVCAYGTAWAVNHVDNPHYYAECSNKGICDRANGECQCFEGYTGRACQRSICPNDCSGHGKCRLIKDYDLSTYTGWDADSIQACVCDGGYTGFDCSQRLCPRGDDPLTLCKDQFSCKRDQVQTITINYAGFNGSSPASSAAGYFKGLVARGADDESESYGEVAGEFARTFNGTIEMHGEIALAYTDTNGEVWYTRGIRGIMGPADSATKIKNALEELPNFRVRTVDVLNIDQYELDALSAEDYTNTTWNYDVTFSDVRNSGNQNLLTCLVKGCMQPGCQPMYRQPRMVWHNVDDTAVMADINIREDSVLVDLDADITDLPTYPLKIGTSPVTAADSGTLDEHDAVDQEVGVDAVIVIKVLDPAEYTYRTDPTAHRGDSVPFEWEIRFSGDTTTASSDTVTGSMWVPFNYKRVHLSNGIYVRFNTRTPTAGTHAFLYSIASCSVSQKIGVDMSVEDAECSNRGLCDRETGTCACHEGYYGDNCSQQTVLV